MKYILIASALIVLCGARPTFVLDDNSFSNLHLVNVLSSHSNTKDTLPEKIVLKRDINDDNLNDNFFEGIFKYAKNDGNTGESKIQLSSLINAVENSLLHSAKNVVVSDGGSDGGSQLRKRYIRF